MIDQRQGPGRVLDPVDHVHADVVDQPVGGHHLLVREVDGDGAHGRLLDPVHQGDEPVEARLELLDGPSPAEQDPALAGLDHDPEGPRQASRAPPRRPRGAAGRTRRTTCQAAPRIVSASWSRSFGDIGRSSLPSRRSVPVGLVGGQGRDGGRRGRLGHPRAVRREAP